MILFRKEGIKTKSVNSHVCGKELELGLSFFLFKILLSNAQ